MMEVDIQKSLLLDTSPRNMNTSQAPIMPNAKAGISFMKEKEREGGS
jgi:hypothetical protein